MDIGGSGALVGGGASGLGAATVRRLHADGAHIVIVDQNADRGAALAAELGERARFVATDVTDPDAVQAAVTVAAEQPVPLRIAVSCAGAAYTHSSRSRP
jgi:3-hydroxyacyl-CoA dehydrogenase / 3-hydroxy-2-methylbutyryl-CoA dehydrogenase